MPSVDLSVMTDDEIEAYAREQVLLSGDPYADPTPLITALKNATAMDKALEDQYWIDIKAKEAAEFRGEEWSLPIREE